MPRAKITPEQNRAKKEAFYAKLAVDVDRSLIYHWKQARKGAVNRNIEFTITADDIIELWNNQQGLCRLSNIPMTLTHGTNVLQNPTKLSIDRIDSRVGYYKDNIQLITWQLNCGKSVWSNEQLIDLCKTVAAIHA
jgi:hypothetical protein